MHKELLSLIAICLTFIAFYPYIRSILAGKTKPHFYSWIIWGVATSIVCFAKLAAGAGVGAIPTGISGLITLYVAWLAYQRRTDISITQSDRVFLVMALASLPVWHITENPLWAVVLLTAIDIMAYIPTLRKAYQMPHSEPIQAFMIMTVRSTFVIAALEHYSVTTVLYAATIGLQCAAMVVMLWLRRKVINA